ncbi:MULTISPECIES: phosphoadenylyl-sulfate reductase [Staphylococcus]|uniref:phosphoadenylyl-sulfate reductase n=1 Tax=Staphylococcus TaxID=1279 RepID=UPI000BC31B5F|nr:MULTISPECIES: phosphoadenylyl-sulfate reductase [Staphylococcus]ATH61238.1 phosphoadenosine phosphosulfate reductase [Staphylococcus nepalensis]ATH66269.1 phosphoadenosine phosphosulfate reductase [Staphylococcus nepalensis]AWI45657.1 phosphoadenosine phosphosulfate reductase [Staphylococcus nepalensis]NWN85661.1 phosphoadenylyl-sulfate reductase [Staphylococcus sp.]
MHESKITYDHFNADASESINIDDETKGAREVVTWAYQTYGESVIYACSFGAEGMILIDLIYSVKKDAQIVFLDTGLHFQETYDLIDRVQARYPELRIKLKKPELTLDEQASQYNPALWKNAPNQCCYIRKIKPLEDVLSGATAWISGLRRSQSLSRQNMVFINKDERFQSVKICPLVHWTWEDVWHYIKKYELHYNELHDFNYPSIGCIPCTAAVEGPGDSREGRWTNSNKTECGLHTTDHPSL